VTPVTLLLSASSSGLPSSTEFQGVVDFSENGYAIPTGAPSSAWPSPAVSSNATPPAPSVMINSTLSGLDPWSNVTSPELTRVSNTTCTVNVRGASLDYWYPATYSHPIGTMTTSFANFSKMDYYTLVTNTATFDVASALESNFACTMSESAYDESWTYTFCMDYSDKPTAAATSLATRSGYVPFPTGGVIPRTDGNLYDIYMNMPTATHSISLAPNRTFDQLSATPYVHFTAYEIESGNSTETIQLPSAYVYPYWVKEVQHEVAAKGPLPEEFMQQISQTGCDSGDLEAVVTVVIVVDLFYENIPAWDPFFIHFESTVLGFEDTPLTINGGSIRMAPLTAGDLALSSAPVEPTPIPSNNNNNIQQGSGSNEAQVPSAPQPTVVTVGNIGTLPVVVGPSSVVAVGSQTLQPGGPAVVVGGVTPVSLVPSATAIVVGGTRTVQLPQVSQEPIPPPLLTIGSSTLTPNAATQFFIAPGQTLTPGGTATIDGTLISLAPSASFVVVGGSTQLLPAAAPGLTVSTRPAQIIVGSTTITALPAQNNNNNQNNSPPAPTFVVDGQTLAPGGQAITVAGTTLSLAPGGTSIVVNGVTSAVANPPSSLVQAPITVGNNVFTPVPGSRDTFVIGDQTLSPGGLAITVSNTVLSLAPSASFVVVNGVISTLPNAAVARPTAAPTLTVGNTVFRPLPGTGTTYQVGSTILTPGGVITIGGSTISLAAGATAIIVNGQTTLLAPGNRPMVTNAPLLTLGSNTFTAVSGTTYIIGGQTLTPGGTITVDGTTISLAPGATQVVYGSSGRSITTALFPATTTGSQAITGTASPSAGASEANGQAAPTSQRTGSASNLHINACVSSLTIAVLALLFC
jgi:hypothetical protein